MIFIWRSLDGRILLISFIDGYCTFIRFGEDEFGEFYIEVKVIDSLEVKEVNSLEVKEEKMIIEKFSLIVFLVSLKVGYFLFFLINFEV